MNREEAIKILKDTLYDERTPSNYLQAVKMGRQALENQKTGHWIKDEEMSIMFDIWKCSECGGGGDKHFKYCSYCGAKME